MFLLTHIQSIAFDRVAFDTGRGEYAAANALAPAALAVVAKGFAGGALCGGPRRINQKPASTASRTIFKYCAILASIAPIIERF